MLRFIAITDDSIGIVADIRFARRSTTLEVHAEMFATVLKVVVEPGETVGPDDTLVILESMKMEIPATAGIGGTVVKVAVREGETVQVGDLLAVLE